MMVDDIVCGSGAIQPQVYKHAGVVVVVEKISVCAETDGEACDTQVFAACPTSQPTAAPHTSSPTKSKPPSAHRPTHSPVTPAPTPQCSNRGSCCAASRCCLNPCDECKSFSWQSLQSRQDDEDKIWICVQAPSCSPTASPTTVFPCLSCL